MKGILGRKLGMTQVFTTDGVLIPVTVVEALPNVVLQKKNLDMIVANNLKVAGAGFGTDTNVVTILTSDGEMTLPMLSKEEVADKILDEILKRLS